MTQPRRLKRKSSISRLRTLRQQSQRGEVGETRNGVPVLTVGVLQICYFGRTDKFRMFGTFDHKKRADFADDETGRAALVAWMAL